MRAPLTLAALALVLACAEAPTQPPVSDIDAAVIRNREVTPLVADQVITSACAGEDIAMHFNQLFVLQEVTREGNSYRFHVTFLDRGSRGVGLTSEDTYHLVGVLKDNFFSFEGSGPSVQTIHNIVGLIGEGTAPNRLLRQFYHITVNPDGTVRIEIGPETEEVCRT